MTHQYLQTRVLPLTVNINLLAPEESIRRELGIVTEAILLRRANLKKESPRTFFCLKVRK